MTLRFQPWLNLYISSVVRVLQRYEFHTSVCFLSLKCHVCHTSVIKMTEMTIVKQNVKLHLWVVLLAITKNTVILFVCAIALRHSQVRLRKSAEIIVLLFPPVYQDLSTCHDWSVKKAIADLPIRMKGNSKRTRISPPLRKRC